MDLPLLWVSFEVKNPYLRYFKFVGKIISITSASLVYPVEVQTLRQA